MAVTLVYLAVFLVMDFSAQFLQSNDGVVPWYPPAGLTLALLLGFGLGYTPAVFCGYVLSNYLLWQATPTWHGVWPGLLALAATASYGGAAWFLLRIVRIDPSLRHLRDIAWLAPLVLTASFIGACCYAAVTFGFESNSGGGFWAIVRDFTLGDATGVFSIAPVLLAIVLPWFRQRTAFAGPCEEQPGGAVEWRAAHISVLQLVEIAVWLLCTALILWVALGNQGDAPGSRLYLAFLPLIWISLRHGINGSVLAILAVALGVIGALWASQGEWELIEVHLFAISFALTGLILGAVVTERRAAQEMWRRYEFIANSPGDLMALLNRRFQYEAVNDAFCAALDRTRAALIGKTASEVWGEQVFAGTMRPAIARAFAGSSDTFEGWLVCPRHGRRYFHISYNPFRDVRGKPTHVVSVARDITEHFEAEHARAKTENLYRKAIAAADAVPYIRDYSQGVESFVFMGEEIERVTGYTSSEMTMELWDSIQQEIVLTGELSGMTVDEAIQRARAGELRRWRSDSRIIAKDGSERWVTDASVEILDDEGQPVGCIGMFIDNTQRKFSERALQATERHQALILRSLPMAVYTTEGVPPFRPTWVSANIVRLCGFEADEFITHGDLWNQRIHPDDRNVAELGYSAVVAKGSTQLEYRWQCKDGSFRWFLDQPSHVRADADGPGEIIGTWLDITERKQAERALRESEERMELALAAADLGLWDWDIVADTLTVNDRFVEMLGYESAECVNSAAYWRGQIHPDDFAGANAIVQAHLAGLTPSFEAEHRMRTKAGEWKWVLNRGMVSVHDPAGKPLRALGTHLDITARREAEEERRKLEMQIQHAQKLESLGVLAGGIAHDFNNLLVGILGNADLALVDMPLDDERRRYLEPIVTSAQRAAELCKQMLAYSGRGQFVVQAVNLSDVVREMSHLLSVSVTKRAKLTFDFQEDLPAVRVDVTQVRQIVMNLITNASEALGEHDGEIHLTTGAREYSEQFLRENYLGDELPAGTYVTLEVRDTGCGMDEATQKRLFDPFFTTKFAGRGLGMAAVLGIVRGHHGTVRVQSAPGEGTTFTVLLPASRDLAEGIIESAEFTSDWRGDGTVLVVDDEFGVRLTARTLLERAGYSVLEAEDGYKALSIFREHAEEVRVVLLDLTMPRLGGEETFRELRRIKPEVRVVLSSGFSEQDTVTHFGESGLAGFLQKPYRAQTLYRAIHQATHERSDGAV
ncbi:MAG: PAS domain-containing protein [Candidatus Hydrogenedentes bacterium]|nr:PAS domain-containing protein [Candidatus Hydrogenedentota bacterium]